VAVAAIATPPDAMAARSQAVRPSDQLVRPASETKPPADHTLSARQAIRVAERSERLMNEVARHPRHRREAFISGAGRWQVSYYEDREEFAQAIVDERFREPVEVWTGPQVAWQMARGLPGAFGRKVNAPYIWIPLMVAFILPFVDWRRPLRLIHLDLLVLLSFSLSLLFFNRGEIFTSVPLVYPVLGYLLLRMLLFAYVRRFREPQAPLRLLVPVAYLSMALIFLVGFRVGLNITNSNVIDVGYSGVIGADRLVHGESLYGDFPNDNASGDTYGPVNYYAYVPFELALPWSGKWDDLPASHAAAIFFDLATLLGLFLVGRRLRAGRAGRDLGIVLAYAWASYPYSLFVLNSNANDSLVAMLLTYSFLVLKSSRLRGAVLALAAAAKFAPLALVPLFASYSTRRQTLLRFAIAFAVTTLIVMLPVLLDGELERFYDRTIGFQLGRDSPFSIWGQEEGLAFLQHLVKGAAIALALLVAFVPRRKTELQVAALGAAVLIAMELSLTHWFYLYIVWFLPFVLIALFGALSFAERTHPDEEPPGDLSDRRHDELDRAREPALA
jgi:Glycosyltransferase family 87